MTEIEGGRDKKVTTRRQQWPLMAPQRIRRKERKKGWHGVAAAVWCGVAWRVPRPSRQGEKEKKRKGKRRTGSLVVSQTRSARATKKGEQMHAMVDFSAKS